MTSKKNKKPKTSPQKKVLSAKARRFKGHQFERDIVNVLKERGIRARRVPLSGALGGNLSGDVSIFDGTFKLELKRQDLSVKRLTDLLADNDALVMKADHRPIYVFCPWDHYLKLLDAWNKLHGGEVHGSGEEGT